MIPAMNRLVYSKIIRNFGIAFLVPYNKDIGRITRF